MAVGCDIRDDERARSDADRKPHGIGEAARTVGDEHVRAVRERTADDEIGTSVAGEIGDRDAIGAPVVAAGRILHGRRE